MHNNAFFGYKPMANNILFSTSYLLYDLCNLFKKKGRRKMNAKAESLNLLLRLSKMGSFTIDDVKIHNKSTTHASKWINNQIKTGYIKVVKRNLRSGKAYYRVKHLPLFLSLKNEIIEGKNRTLKLWDSEYNELVRIEVSQALDSVKDKKGNLMPEKIESQFSLFASSNVALREYVEILERKMKDGYITKVKAH